MFFRTIAAQRVSIGTMYALSEGEMPFSAFTDLFTAVSLIIVLEISSAFTENRL